MAGENQSFDVSVDLGNSEAQLRSFAGSLNTVGVAVDNLVVKNVQFNRSGQAVRQQFAGIATDGRAVEISTKRVGDAFQLMSAKVTETAQRLKELRETARQIRFDEANKAASEFFKDQGIGPALDARLQDRAQSAQRALARALAAPGVVDGDLSRIFNDLQSGIVRAEAGVKGRLQSALLQVLNVQRQITVEINKQNEIGTAGPGRRELAQGVIGGLRSQFPAPDNATLQQLSTYENRLRAIATLIAGGKVGVDEVQKIADAVRSGKITEGLTPNEGRVQTALVSIQSMFKETSKEGKTAIDQVNAAWQRLENIVSRLLIRQAVFAFIGALKQGVTDAIALDQAVARIQNTGNAASLSLGQINRSVRQLSDTNGIPQLQVAAAALELFQNRAASGAEGLSLLNDALRLSTATGQTAEQSIRALTEVMNTFRLGNQQAAQTSDLLFRTAQLGGSSVNEVGTAMARAGQSANALGIPIEQVAAFIATLGQNGINAGRSAQILESILSSLLRPSTELEQIFQRIGVRSGETAIATFGLTGTLQRLAQETRGSITELDRVIGGVRQLGPVIGQTGSNFQQFDANLQQVRNSLGAVSQAADVVATTAGRRLETEFVRIANTFTQLGSGSLQSLNSFTSAIGGLSGAFEKLTPYVLLIGGAYIGLRTYTLATAAATVTYNAAVAIATNSTTKFGLEATRLTIGIRGLGAALTTVASAAGFLATVAIAGSFVYQQLTAGQNEFAGISEETEQRLRAIHNDTARQQLNDLANVQRRDQELLDSRIRNVQGYVTGAQRILTQFFRDTEEASKRSAEAFKLQTTAVIDEARQRLSAFTQDASRAQNQIRESQKLVETFQAKSNESVFQRALRFEEDPNRGIDIIRQRIAQLRREYQELYARGDDAAIAGARQRIEQIIRLTEEAFQRQVQVQRTRAQLGLDIIQPTTDSFGRERRQISVDVLSVQREITALQREQARLEQDLQRRQTERLAASRQQETIERTRLQALEAASREIVNFRALDEQGRIRREFRGANPAEQGAEALREFDRRRSELEQQLGPAAFRAFDQAAGLSSRRQIIERQIQIAITQDHAEQLALRLTRERQHTEQLVQEQTNRASRLQQSFREQHGANINQTVGDLESILGRPAGIPGIGTGNANDEVQIAATTLRARQTLSIIRSIQQEITRTQEAGGVITPAQIQRLQEAVNIFRQAFAQAQEARRQAGVENLSVARPAQGNQPERTTREIFDLLNGQIESLRGARQEFDDANQRIVQARLEQERLATALAGHASRLREIPGLSQAAADALRSMPDQAGQGIRSLTDDIGRLASEITRLQQSIPAPIVRPGGQPFAPVPRPGQGVSGGGGRPGGRDLGDLNPEFFAEGGPVPGGPRGTDTVPAWLTPGEYVWDTNTVQRFYPLIRALHTQRFNNNGPQYLSKGGQVTNVGDINVTVQGNGNSRESAREIARHIQREIRRGTILQSDLTNGD